MLFECYGRVGSDEKRLDALRRFAEGDQSPESARIELAQTLARQGKFDQALTTLVPVVVRRPERWLDFANILLQRAIHQSKERRNWQEIEQTLKKAEKALPHAVEPVVLMRVDMLAAQDRLDDARSLLSTALSKEPHNLRYRLALARLIQRQGPGRAALQVLNDAEKDLGPSPDIVLTRLDYWGVAGGSEATAEVAKLAATRDHVPESNRRVLLDRLGVATLRLGQPDMRDNTGASWHCSNRKTSRFGLHYSTWP